MIIKNLIKYTLGLPLLILFSIALIAYSVGIIIFDFLGNIVDLVIYGDTEFYTTVDILSDLEDLWRPIR